MLSIFLTLKGVGVMEHIFKDYRIELFFGVFILFFSFTGVLGYISPELVLNIYYLLLFFIGIMLGSLLVSMSLGDYFQGITSKSRKSSRRR